MLSFHTAPLRGRVAAEPSAALVPTLGAIEKCKFILLLPVLPTCKTILGHNGPTERQRGSRWAGKEPGWDRLGWAAPRVRAAHAAPGRGTLLGVISPWVLHCPSQEDCRRFCPRGQTTKSDPEPQSSMSWAGWRGCVVRGGQQGPSPITPEPGLQGQGSRGGGQGPHIPCGAVGLGCRTGLGMRSCPRSQR